MEVHLEDSTLVPPISSPLTREDLVGSLLDRLLGCGVCGELRTTTYEVSALAEDSAEISGSVVMKLLHLCDPCASSLLTGNWGDLYRRKRTPR